MGLIGSAVARLLDERGEQFTWSDKETKVNALSLSTGIISPNHHNRSTWLTSMGKAYVKYTEYSPYWFFSKGEPHGGNNGIIDDTGVLRRSGLNSLHFNVPMFVNATRRMFAERRTEQAKEGAKVIIAHGFDRRRVGRFMWGWAAAVKVQYPEELYNGANGERPCFYLREGRYVLDYMYPIPNTEFWWLGTSLISQKVPRPLKVMPKLEKCANRVAEKTGGQISISNIAEVRQGWRPVPRKGDNRPWANYNGELVALSRWNDGVMTLPETLSALESMIGG